jgi:hypothetical protein
MAATGTKTANDIVTAALRKAGITGLGQEPAPEDAAEALSELTLMLKEWQSAGYNLWTKTRGTLTLAAGASQTLDPVRPLRILSARYKASATASELFMQEMTRDEYDRLPVKDSAGTPTTFYYDRQREAAVLYVWPVLAAATGQTIEYTYERELEDMTNIAQEVDVPGEWWSAVVYNLALRMAESVSLDARVQVLTPRAFQLLDDAQGGDREGSVFFAGEYA